MWQKLETVEQRYEELGQRMAQPEVAADYEQIQRLAKERAEVETVVSPFPQYNDGGKALAEARSILGESDDPDIRALAQDEVAALEGKRERLGREIRQALLPKDPYDEKDVIVEV